ncbi:transcription factor c2h2 [Stemphylium lycopersici]|nr:transcription factor c2h2 [Stemphylium lycopersici]
MAGNSRPQSGEIVESRDHPISGLLTIQLTATWIGQNCKHGALFFIPQASVSASSRNQYTKMTSTIASPVPLRFNRPQRTTNELKTVDPGRETPLPQYEKIQSLPFTFNLQEDARNPGQFQLVLDIGSKQQGSDGVHLNSTTEPTNDGLGATGDSSESKPGPPSLPTTPLSDKQGWSDLSHVPPEFLKKVVPDWTLSFSRSDSTVSTQSKRLADIKARFKKKGKGYVVRLLKASTTDSDEIAEVDLGSQASKPQLNDTHELDSATLPAELYSPPSTVTCNMTGLANRPDVFEIGTSNEEGIEPVRHAVDTTPDLNHVSHMRTLAWNSLSRNSVAEDGMSDAETLIPDVRSMIGHLDEEQTDLESFSQITSMAPSRSASTSSIVQTPKRGLSLVGPVRKRVEKRTRIRVNNRTTDLELKRSDAHKSVKHRVGPSRIATESILTDTSIKPMNLRHASSSITRRSNDYSPIPEEHGTWQHPVRYTTSAKPRSLRHLSADDIQLPSESRYGLRLKTTNLPQAKSADVSPVNHRKRSPRTRKPKTSLPSSADANNAGMRSSPKWQEVSHLELNSEALRRALNDVVPHLDDFKAGASESNNNHSVPRIVEPTDIDHVGEIPLPSEVEIRSAPAGVRNPTLIYWGLAFNALSDKVYDGFKLLRDAIGTEQPVPEGHVRVRWTCTCGDPLYDDFIEQRPNAARLLEAYLNRPRAHTPRSPTSQSSTASSMTSIFDSASRASTLATPSSTHGGPDPWSRGNDPSKYSPSRIRSDNPFSVRMPSFAEESWLLTCANEGRMTPKIVHLDVNESRIRSDKDLATSLREHYDQLNYRWFNWARLRGLTTIEFVQFEVHRNRFADIRATPSMPPKSASSSVSATTEQDKSRAPSQQPYTFEPNDLLPPVGSTYLLHLFQHPNDYDGELITYLRCPKRRQRLEFGMGWGVHLVEGFLAQRVWAVTMGVCGLGSAAFAILWTIKKDDIQGAFGVAQWVLGIAVLLVGAMQAWLE